MSHALLSPSGMSRWGNCPGSLAGSKGYPNESNEFAREGSAAHLLGERALGYERNASFWIGEEISISYEENGVQKSQSFVVDDDMAEAVQVYVDAVNREPGELDLEVSVDLEPVYGVPGQFGTADAVKLDVDSKRLYVCDLKFGRGIQVYAENNEQLMSYAAGAYKLYSCLAEIETITMVISQPRLGHHDEHTISAVDLENWIETRAKPAAKRAYELYHNGDAAAIEKAKAPGESQCQWCPLKAECRPLAEWAHKQVFDDFVTLSGECSQVSDAGKISDDELAAIWNRRDTISGWLTAVQSETKKRLEAGIAVKGLKLVQGRAGPRKWIDEDDAEARLKAARLKVDEMYTKKLISPTQAEKSLKKSKPRVWTAIKDFITQNPGAPAVAPENDKRPELKIAEAEQFADATDDVSDLF